MLTAKSNTIEKEYIIISILEWRNEFTFENLLSVIHYMNGQETNHMFILLGPGHLTNLKTYLWLKHTHTHTHTHNFSPKMIINLIPNGEAQDSFSLRQDCWLLPLLFHLLSETLSNEVRLDKVTRWIGMEGNA